MVRWVALFLLLFLSCNGTFSQVALQTPPKTGQTIGTAPGGAQSLPVKEASAGRVQRLLGSLARSRTSSPSSPSEEDKLPKKTDGLVYLCEKCYELVLPMPECITRHGPAKVIGGPPAIGKTLESPPPPDGEATTVKKAITQWNEAIEGSTCEIVDVRTSMGVDTVPSVEEQRMHCQHLCTDTSTIGDAQATFIGGKSSWEIYMQTQADREVESPPDDETTVAKRQRLKKVAHLKAKIDNTLRRDCTGFTMTTELGMMPALTYTESEQGIIVDRNEVAKVTGQINEYRPLCRLYFKDYKGKVDTIRGQNNEFPSYKPCPIETCINAPPVQPDNNHTACSAQLGQNLPVGYGFGFVFTNLIYQKIITPMKSSTSYGEYHSTYYFFWLFGGFTPMYIIFLMGSVQSTNDNRGPELLNDMKPAMQILVLSWMLGFLIKFAVPTQEVCDLSTKSKGSTFGERTKSFLCQNSERIAVILVALSSFAIIIMFIIAAMTPSGDEN